MFGPTPCQRDCVIPEWRGRVPAAPRLQFDHTSLALWNYYRKPTTREIRGARTGDARFAIVPGGQHTLFWLYDIEHLTRTWSAARFALGLVPPDRRNLPEREPRQGWLLWCLLVDADSGVCHAIRATSLTPVFSVAFNTMVQAQRDHLPQFSPAAYKTEITAAHRRWPTAEDMLDSAVAIERRGLKWALPPRQRCRRISRDEQQDLLRDDRARRYG
jgi:hypothetical protein